MVEVKLIITAIIALVAIAVPAYLTAMFLSPAIGAIVAVCITLGIAGGRYVAAQQAGGNGGSANRGRARQSKGARGRDR